MATRISSIVDSNVAWLFASRSLDMESAGGVTGCASKTMSPPALVHGRVVFGMIGGSGSVMTGADGVIATADTVEIAGSASIALFVMGGNPEDCFALAGCAAADSVCGDLPSAFDSLGCAGGSASTVGGLYSVDGTIPSSSVRREAGAVSEVSVGVGARTGSIWGAVNAAFGSGAGGANCASLCDKAGVS